MYDMMLLLPIYVFNMNIKCCSETIRGRVKQLCGCFIWRMWRRFLVGKNYYHLGLEIKISPKSKTVDIFDNCGAGTFRTVKGGERAILRSIIWGGLGVAWNGDRKRIWMRSAILSTGFQALRHLDHDSSSTFRVPDDRSLVIDWIRWIEVGCGSFGIHLNCGRRYS